MSFVVIAVLIVLTALAVGYVGLLLEEHAEWREWHVPRGKEFTPCPLEYGEHDGLLLTDVEYAIRKDLLEGAHARMTQSFRLRDRDARPVIQPDRTW